jgi:imidazole glycerol phosphate synthase glutamine amidotransferase subunit
VRVAICDYGAGNVRSVELAFRRLGCDVADDVARADLAVLPGVGSARSAMTELRARGHDETLRRRVEEGRAVLGICLGLQLALEWTEEDGGVEGLALLPGRAVRLRDGRVPRIGWADVAGSAYYFAHSYAAATPAASAFSEGVVAEARAGSFVGVQFHPEKSGAAGARYLARLLAEVEQLSSGNSYSLAYERADMAERVRASLFRG